MFHLSQILLVSQSKMRARTPLYNPFHKPKMEHTYVWIKLDNTHETAIRKQDNSNNGHLFPHFYQCIIIRLECFIFLLPPSFKSDQMKCIGNRK